MGKLMNKLDNFDSPSQTGTKAIEVDIKKRLRLVKWICQRLNQKR